MGSASWFKMQGEWQVPAATGRFPVPQGLSWGEWRERGPKKKPREREIDTEKNTRNDREGIKKRGGEEEEERMSHGRGAN